MSQKRGSLKEEGRRGGPLTPYFTATEAQEKGAGTPNGGAGALACGWGRVAPELGFRALWWYPAKSNFYSSSQLCLEFVSSDPPLPTLPPGQQTPQMSDHLSRRDGQKPPEPTHAPRVRQQQQQGPNKRWDGG